MAFTPSRSLSTQTNPSFGQREIVGALNEVINTDSAALSFDRSSGNVMREKARAFSLMRTAAGVHATPVRTLWSNLAVQAITAVTAETTLLDATGNGNLNIPVRGLVAGAVYEFEASGLVTTDTSGTYTLKAYLGATGTTALVTGTAITPVASQTDDFWNLKLAFQVLTAGASGKVLASGIVTIEQSTRKLAKLVTAVAGASIDLSVDNLFAISSTCSVGGTNSLRVLNAALRRVR